MGLSPSKVGFVALALVAWGLSASHAGAQAATGETDAEASAAVGDAATDAATEPAGAAHAESGATTEDEVIPVRGRDQRRPIPDYDGLDEPPPAPEEVLIWIPRVLLSPLWFVSEIVVREPLGALLTWAEREQIPLRVLQLLTWDHHRAGIVPTPFFDFGQLPSIGLYFFWNDLGAPGHQLRVHLGFGGVDYQRAAVRDRVLLAERTELSVRVEAWRWPDRPFQGTGWQSVQGERARYRQNLVDGMIELAMQPWRRSRLALQAGVRWTELSPDGYALFGDEPSLASAVDQGTFNALPSGFGGFLAYRQRLEGVIDTRTPRPGGGSGVRIDGYAEQATDLSSPITRRWLRYAGGVAAFLDAGSERVLSLHVRAAFADPLGSEPVPLTEQVTLGGNLLDMPGYLRSSIVGRSSVVATLRYRWPVWVWLDAMLFVATGNVFEEHLSDFSVERLRLSWGLFLQSTGDRDAGLRIGIAFGTRAFARGGDVESVRFQLGGTLGF